MKCITLLPALLSLMLAVIAPPVHSFNEATVIQQKKLAISRLQESGLSGDEAETYTMYLQIALAEATQWEIMDFSVTSSLIAERGGTEDCNKMQCAIINGQLLSVDYICFGTIETIGRTFSLNVQIADVGSGRQVANISKFFKGKEKVFTSKTIPQVAQQLASTIIGKKAVEKNQSRETASTFENIIEQQTQKSFSDVRGYLDYGSSSGTGAPGTEKKIETSGKLAFGYLQTGRRMLPDDALRYSYQLQSYLADVGACAMLYIDEMERLMKLRGGNLQCGTMKCAKSVGRLLGVDYMGYGDIRRRCGKFIIHTYIVDVETGEHVTEVTKRFRGKEIVFLTEIIPQIAYKLGEVLERKQIGRR